MDDDAAPEQDPLRSAFVAEIEALAERIRELSAEIEAGKHSTLRSGISRSLSVE